MARRNAKGEGEKKKDGSERWLLTYSDMMNNLLILFMVLYAMSVIDLNKFEALARELKNALSPTDAPMTDETLSEEYKELAAGENVAETASQMAANEAAQEGKDQFDQVYQELQEKIKESGYEQQVTLEKGDNYIKIKFGDNVLFYPDSPKMKTDEVQVLKIVGDILYSINPLIQSIEIAGHTATTGNQTDSTFSWELSSGRAISVLDYLVHHCNLPEAKMYISGFSRYHPVASNEDEDSRQLNRRVEIKITKVEPKAS